MFTALNKKEQIRTRIAPSPTGTLHIGTARAALFNFLFARHNKGEFFLRIEDTDEERSKPEFEQDIIDNLKWLGLEWDGKILKQSQRKEIYTKYIKQLLDSGKAFWCYHTKEELEKEKQDQQNRGEPQIHFCRNKNEQNSKLKIKNLKLTAVIRLKCPNKKIVFDDLIRGKIEFDSSLIGDIVIAKDKKSPLYNFAVVIDDYESKITHVVRGEDHISNTPKQIMISEALGLPLPQYAHMALTLAPDKTKLSKRHGATSIQEYKEMGYLPEAMVNFMAFLGWNPGTEKEIFSLDELIKEFSIERMQKSAAIFNIEKLNWFNAYYIKKAPLKKLTELCIPYLIQDKLIEPIWGQEMVAGQARFPFETMGYKITSSEEPINFNYLQQIVKLEQERLKKLSVIGELAKFFFEEPKYDKELLRWKDMANEEIKANIDKLYNILFKIKEKNFTDQKLKDILMPIAEETGDRGKLLWPLRAALSGLRASPGPFELMAAMGKEKALRRLKTAYNKL
jgi:glutamyl-tRNA synthetase